MELSKEDLLMITKVEVMIQLQLLIENFDLIFSLDPKMPNKKLQSNMKAILLMLEKETNNYNKLYAVSESDTLYFRNVLENNIKAIGSRTIIEKGHVDNYLACLTKNPKALDGIVTKILKQ